MYVNKKNLQKTCSEIEYKSNNIRQNRLPPKNKPKQTRKYECNENNNNYEEQDSLPNYSDNIVVEYSNSNNINNINTFPKKKYSTSNYSYDMMKFSKKKSNSSIVQEYPNNNIISLEDRYKKINSPNNIFVCPLPEAHNVSDKINFYERTKSNLYPDLNDSRPSAPYPPHSPNNY